MRATYFADIFNENVTVYLNNINDNDSFKALAVIIAEKTSIHFDDLNKTLSTVNKPVFGGVFPELIYNSERYNEGVMFLEINYSVSPSVINLKSDNIDTYIQQIANSASEINFEYNSIYVFLDAFSSNKLSFVNALYDFFGTTVKYIGGGAGRLSFKQEPCLIKGSEIYADSALVVFSAKDHSIGVAHGWEPISEPIKVSKAEKNIVYELNWKPAFEVYKNIVESHSNQKFTTDNFFDIAKSYPLGISKLDTELIVRDPLFVGDNNSLVIVDEVPQGDFVQILNGNKDSLIKSAGIASDTAINRASDNDLSAMFCIDCISRVLYLQNDFGSEIQKISDRNNLNGILTIGEIANSGDGYLDIFNKTVVVII